MRTMTARFFTALLILFIAPALTFAQKDDYQKRSEQIAQTVWGENDPAFQVKTVPAEYNNESAVILAKKYDIDAASRSKFKVGILTMGVNKEIIYRYCLRERVKIQDKAALEDFSEINYQKLNQRSNNFMLVKMRDKQLTYIGARVIKADGSTREVKMEESVAIRNDKNIKEDKLAIPDLQVGDILDFYIQSEAQLELTPLDPVEFLLAAEYPILHFTIRGNVSRKYAIEYRNANNAPELKIDRDADEDFVFLLNQSNLPKISAGQWFSGYRQLPYLKLHIFLGARNSSRNRFRNGEVSKGLTETELIEDVKTEFSQYRLFASLKQIPLFNDVRAGLSDKFSEYEKKNGTGMDTKRKIETIFSYLRFRLYFTPSLDDAIAVGKERNSYKGSNKYFAYSLSLLLSFFEIPNELVVVSGRYSPLLRDYLSTDEPDYLVHVSVTPSMFLTDDGIISNFGLLPGEYEGEHGYTLKFAGKSNSRSTDLEQGKIDLPVSTASSNIRMEKLNVEIALGQDPTIRINRRVDAYGLYKKDDQLSLLYFEDYYDSLRKWLGETKTFLAVVEDKKRGKPLVEEYKTAFARARTGEKDYYVDELKNKYGVDPKEVFEYRLDSMGDLPEARCISFTTTFTIADWLKPAGPNYIFEVGKLIGMQSVVNESERTRNADIYMPFARTLVHRISIQIPDGYKVEGVELLDKDISNETGYFRSKANLDGKKLVITVSKQYSHNFDPSSNWPKILDFIDAANDFCKSKLLLRKM